MFSLACCGDSGQPLPVMLLEHAARDSSSNQNPAQRPARSQLPDFSHHNFVRTPRPAHHGFAPRMNTALEVAQSLFQLGIKLLQLAVLICQSCNFIVAFHLFSPSSVRTLPNARERCAFTVPSLRPVASAISFSSRSSTKRNKNTVRCRS